MATASNTTKDHNQIRRWIEERGGKPATVTSTKEGGEPGILRVDFPGYSGEGSLEPISWEQFFEKFDENDLTFLYQDQTKDGSESRFHKFISGDSSE